MPHPKPADDHGRVRLDKWLWAARLYKTRSLAAQAIEAGHVRVDGQRCKPARAARLGDRLEVTRGHERMELVIRALASLRGAAPQAQSLYEETAESIARQTLARSLRAAAAGREHAAATGRPTKRDRRRLDRWRGSP
jgi:ribosome-associated heat shock protein Hsp15